MPTIKIPIEILSEVTNISVTILKFYEFERFLTPSTAYEFGEAYHNQFDCIDKQTAIDFCQSMLKDYSTIEVTQETLNNFLNKK